jgi:hypothetical protein
MSDIAPRPLEVFGAVVSSLSRGFEPLKDIDIGLHTDITIDQMCVEDLKVYFNNMQVVKKHLQEAIKAQFSLWLEAIKEQIDIKEGHTPRYLIVDDEKVTDEEEPISRPSSYGEPEWDETEYEKI